MKLPPDWTKSLLHHLAYIQTGVSKSENRKGPSVKRPYLRVANVQDGYIDLSEMKEINVPVGQVERFTLQKDDLVLTEGGDFDKLGRGCIWNGEIPDCVHQNHIFAVRVLDKKVLLPRFLAYQMQAPYGRQYFMACAKQTTNLASINSSQLKKFPVLFPSHEEQHQIIDMLATWDDAIEKAEKLIEAKEKRFSWLLNRFIDEGCVKGEWRRVKLGEVGEISSAGVDKKSSQGEIPVRLVNYLDVYRRDLIYSHELNHFVTAPPNQANRCSVRKGDIFFTPSSEVRDDIGHSAVAMEDIPDAAYSYHVVRLRLHENWDLLYRAYAFKSQNFFKQAQMLCDGSGQRYVISQHNFRNMEVSVPPLDQQKKTSSILNTAHQEIDLLKKQAKAYRKQKRGLIQMLLTGKWRVKADEGELVK